MLHILYTVVLFLAVLIVLVLAHEWGHYVTARFFGVRVDEFGFGFPPKIMKLWHRHGTDFTLNWIPLGGFVRLKGEDGAEAHDADSFAHKAVWKRLVILVAGVCMNFVLGYFIFVGIYSYGMEMVVPYTPVGIDQHAIVRDARVEVGALLEKSPADLAGIKPFDQILRVNGVAVPHADALRARIRASAPAPVTLQVKRINFDAGTSVVFDATMTPRELQPGVTGIGVEAYDIGTVRYKFPYMFVQAGRDTRDVSLLIFNTLGSLIKTAVQHGQLEQGVSGPVGIAVITGKVARTGLVPFLQLVALLSINLGLLNIIPFPALDGGRALFVILEKVLRKKVRTDIERVAHLVGFAVLMALVLTITVRDVVHLFR